MTATARNEAELQLLVQLLSRGQFMTASQIAYRMGCSKPSAYKRVRTLRERGLPIQVERVRDGISGPQAEAFAIISRVATKKR